MAELVLVYQEDIVESYNSYSFLFLAMEAVRLCHISITIMTYHYVKHVISLNT